MARSLELSERGRDAETRLNNQSAPYAHDSCPLGFMAELETIQRNNNPLYGLEEHCSCRKWCMGGRHVEMGAAAVV